MVREVLATIPAVIGRSWGPAGFQRAQEDLRDRARLRFPRALKLYQSYVRSRLPGDTRHYEFSDWTQRGVELLARMGTVGVRYERNEIWIEDPEGDQWLYTPGLFGSALWAEYGLIYEGEEIELLAGLLPQRGCVIDVGANIGLHSVKLSKRVHELLVHAFEPVNTTFAALVRNVERNGAGRAVRAHHMAISDHDGKVTLTAGFRPGNFVVPNDARARGTQVEAVTARRVDSLVAELGIERVDLVKCDVEGHEMAVLTGATGTLNRCRPLVFVEIMERYARRYGHSTMDVFELMRRCGYRYDVVVDGARQPPSSSPAADLRRTTNFLFVPIG